MDSNDGLLADWRARALELETLAGRAVIGQARALRLITIATFARGHVLLQGDVGVGKTTLLRSVAQLIGGAFGRVEGTIDLMPNDLIYHTHLTADGRPQVDPGPLTQHGDELAIFFFNEINRARPQVHALLLRVMAERSLNAFNREIHFPHLQVFADRNRVEREETFEISSAARDRFMMEITIDAPASDADRRALMFDTRFHDTDALVASLPAAMLPYRELGAVAAAIQHGVQASDALRDYALHLWRATSEPAHFGVSLLQADVRAVMLAGASPRGMSLMLRAARVAAWLDGRSYATPEDLRAVFFETIAHRLCLQPVYELRRTEIIGELMAGIVAKVAAP
jgi:MoxR-like ATPase